MSKEETSKPLFDMAGHLIRRLNQVSTTIFHHGVQAAGHDLTPVQFAAMHALRFNPNIEQAQVAALIAYDRATIGGVIDRLEHKGLVSRIVSKRDRRARECCLTRQGHHVLEHILPVIESLQGDILRGLDEQERQQFLALAQKAIIRNQAQKR